MAGVPRQLRGVHEGTGACTMMYILKINIIEGSLHEGCLLEGFNRHIGLRLQGLLLVYVSLVVFDVFDVHLNLL